MRPTAWSARSRSTPAAGSPKKATGTPLPAENSPRRIFERLFVPESTADKAVTLIRYAERRSILDAISGDAKSLHCRLGTTDQKKLDQCRSSVRDTENQVEQIEGQFMGMLKKTAEADGSMLDRTVILYGSGMHSGKGQGWRSLAKESAATRRGWLETGVCNSVGIWPSTRTIVRHCPTCSFRWPRKWAVERNIFRYHRHTRRTGQLRAMLLLGLRKPIGFGVPPLIARSASTSPTTLANLKPWPEKPAAIATCGWSG